jgi:hypothetical protein
MMTPLRVAQALNGFQIDIATQNEAEAGIDNTKMMTPLRVAQAINLFKNETIQIISSLEDRISILEGQTQSDKSTASVVQNILKVKNSSVSEDIVHFNGIYVDNGILRF